MKDLLAKLDALHEKAFAPRMPSSDDLDWDFTQGDFDSQLCARMMWERWPEVRSYIAKLEAAAGALPEQATSGKHE